MIDNMIEIESANHNISISNNSYTTHILDIENTILDNVSEHILVIESLILDSINNIDIFRYNDFDLTLTNTTYADLPDFIPIDIITGNLHVSRIDGLDDYLNTIPIDGGTP
jgi:hypothetical protein